MLGSQCQEYAGEYIAAATCCHACIACSIHGHASVRGSHNGSRAFEDDMYPQSLGEGRRLFCALLRVILFAERLQQPYKLAGMGREQRFFIGLLQHMGLGGEQSKRIGIKHGG